MPKNILIIHKRSDFRQWLLINHSSESECWVKIKRGKPSDDEHLWYIDAVEEALCFGWIDSTMQTIDGHLLQRFSPRRKNSHWTELNKERCRRLEQLGLMTDAGRASLPKMHSRSFKFDTDFVNALKQARVWSKFKQFPLLYQRIRANNLSFTKVKNPQNYSKALTRLIEETKKGRTYGVWNDYGRLLTNDEI
jgi:hypothetical protein